MNWEATCTDMCRACMKIGGILLPMYDDDTISRKNLPSKLAELASIQIDRFDGLPTMLCAKCAYRTDAFYEFKQQVQANERKLRNMFKANSAPVKEEPITSDGEQECIKINDVGEKLHMNNMNDSDILEEIKIDTEDNQPLHVNVSELIQQTDGKIDISLRNLLLSKVEEAEIYNQDKSHIIQREMPEEISKILQEQNLDYTIMYIPEEDIDSVIDSNNENSDAVELEHRIKMYNTQEIYISTTDVLTDSANNEKILHAASFSDARDSRNIDQVNVEDQKFSFDHPSQTQTGRESAEIYVANSSVVDIETKHKSLSSEDSDSDYFIDPKDNILGSLNDTITRIKEIKKENNVIQYQCTLCLQDYDELTRILLHTVDNHVPSTGPFFCVVCEKDCDNHKELRSHVRTHTGQFPYSCFMCNKAYTMKRYLKRHMVCHTDFPRHRCPKCGVRFKIKSELESHITTHIHGAPFACSQCSRSFNHKGNYKRHLITHLDPQGLHLPKYPCKVCGKRFLNNRTLETHMRVHTGEKPFKCDICGRSFSQQGNLLNHLRIHSNPRSYTCEVCGKRFNQRATLRDHSLLHTGEKPYVCSVCGIAFTFSAALRRHMWTHAGGKPFGCEFCNARFVGKYDLRRHMRVHSDKPRIKRRKNVDKTNNVNNEECNIETIAIMKEQDTETVLVEEVLLNQDVMQVVPQEESEKENVDALFNLIQYGE